MYHQYDSETPKTLKPAMGASVRHATYVSKRTGLTHCVMGDGAHTFSFVGPRSSSMYRGGQLSTAFLAHAPDTSNVPVGQAAQKLELRIGTRPTGQNTQYAASEGDSRYGIPSGHAIPHDESPNDIEGVHIPAG